MYYALDDFADPQRFVLQDADRFHAIRHSGEIRLGDGTVMVLVIFIICRKSGMFDQFIVNKFFLADGAVSRSLMSKCGIPATKIEQTLATTSSAFAKAVPAIRWDELDLRAVGGRDEQTERIKRWGRLRSVVYRVTPETQFTRAPLDKAPTPRKDDAE